MLPVSKIEDVTAADEGIYKCMAERIDGKAGIAEMFINIEEGEDITVNPWVGTGVMGSSGSPHIRRRLFWKYICLVILIDSFFKFQ